MSGWAWWEKAALALAVGLLIFAWREVRADVGAVVVPLPAPRPAPTKDDELPQIPEVPRGARSHAFDLGLDLRDPDGRHTIVVIPGFHGWQACASGAREAGARWGVDGSRIYAKCFDKGPPVCPGRRP